MSFRFSNDWTNQGENNCGVYAFTLFRAWWCSFSIGIEICNFALEWERKC